MVMICVRQEVTSFLWGELVMLEQLIVVEAGPIVSLLEAMHLCCSSLVADRKLLMLHLAWASMVLEPMTALLMVFEVTLTVPEKNELVTEMIMIPLIVLFETSGKLKHLMTLTLTLMVSQHSFQTLHECGHDFRDCFETSSEEQR